VVLWSANLWWPDDRAWCVATEIDFNTTYVGGSTAGVEDLLGDARFEAMNTLVTNQITSTSDRLNPPAPT
jgi:hypothetical protein